MTNPAVCSRAGVSDVEIWVLDEFNGVADQFDRPCFPDQFRTRGASVGGDTIRPGEYTLLIAGTRANGLPWGTCPEGSTVAPEESGDSDTDGFVGADDGDEDTEVCTGDSVFGFLAAAAAAGTPMCTDGECNLGLDSCDCTTFTVEAEKTRRLDDFVLAAPPDCEDGIDGDADGLVDQLDPGCVLGDSESTPVLVPEIELNVSVLSGNPVADCGNIDVGALRLTVDGDELDPILCNIGTTRFSTPLAVGAHELTVVGVGTGQAEAITVEKSLSFSVDDLGVATPRTLDVDFADVDLLEPLDAQLQFQYEFSLPDDEGEPVLCAGVGNPDVRYRILDLGGQPLTSLAAPLDGSVSECSTARVVSLEAPRWGGYTVEIEAFNAGGDLCWSNADAPAPLTPSEAQTAVLAPVDGAPASCFNG